jgi:hypothetical protein
MFVVALCVWCGWVSGFRRATSPAVETWICSLVAVVVIDHLIARGTRDRQPGIAIRPSGSPWPRSGVRGCHVTLLGLAPWLAIFLVGLVWEFLGIDTGAREAHLTISALSEAFRPLNAALLLVWMSIGIGYGVARAHAPLDEAKRATDPAPGVTSPIALPLLIVHPQGFGVALLLPNNRDYGVGFWVGLVSVALLVDLFAPRSRGRVAGAGELVRFLSRRPVSRALLFAGWAFAGWHLFGG